MKNQFVPYKQALELKELGFDGKCIKGFYEGEPIYTIVSTPVDFNNKKQLGELISAPLWQQAFDWFREKHNFDLCWKPMSMVGVTLYYDIEIHHPKYVWDKPPKVTGKTYEEARLECLNKLIELCKKN